MLKQAQKSRKPVDNGKTNPSATIIRLGLIILYLSVALVNDADNFLIFKQSTELECTSTLEFENKS